jgi:hypothetical protein
MAYITRSKGARQIAARKAGRGLDVFLSHHVTYDRLPERLAHLIEDRAMLDKWVLTTLYNAIINKTAVQDAPSAFYSDSDLRRDDDCYYAVAEIAPGYSVCMVFARKGHEVIIITVLRPLSGNRAWQKADDRKAVEQGAGGRGRVRRGAA